jgi:hypothetical protein
VATGFGGCAELGGEIEDATTVLGAEAAVVVTSLGSTRGAGFGELGIVVDTGTGWVAGGAVCGGSVAGTGVATVVVTVGGAVTTGTVVVGG